MDIGTMDEFGQVQEIEYVSDLSALIVYSQQGWGQLGMDTCAHMYGLEGMPLRIGDKQYAKGLGHHAPGEIHIELGGLYETFEADVGLQRQDDGGGSVVFQVYVDDELRFESGVMGRDDPAVPISIPVSGAQDLRLVVTAAGDGMMYDCANWADARLVKAASPALSTEQARVDIARFARVITNDPDRTDGARASRVEEFRAEDLFLDTELLPDNDGTYQFPATSDGRSVIGLGWTERRLVREVRLRFADVSSMPSTDGVQVQGWVGITAHQGNWQGLAGEIQVTDNEWILRIGLTENPETRAGIWKVRWIIPASDGPLGIAGQSAFTSSRWDTAEIALRLKDPIAGAVGRVTVHNGDIVSDGAPYSLDWKLDEPLRMTIRYCATTMQKYDRTVLRISLPSGSFGVAVDDVLANDCVYASASGLMVSRADSNTTPAEYEKLIADKKTILELVREMPDQTFAQAMEKTHNPIQAMGPMLLSLACDNAKFIVHREGRLQFSGQGTVPDSPVYRHELVPHFGSGANAGLTRNLDWRWLPIHVVAVEENNVTYRQRTAVVPHDKTDPSKWLNRQPLCISEFNIENRGNEPADVSLRLEFASTGEPRQPLEISATSSGTVLQADGLLLAYVDDGGLDHLITSTGDGFAVSGTLPANTSARCFVYIPGWTATPDEHTTLGEGKNLRADVEAYWTGVMSPAAKIEIPDQGLLDVILASQVHCLIAARNEDEGARVAPWIASVSYGPLESEANSIIRGMGFLGHEDFARRSHDFFIGKYNDQGFLTTGYTLMGTGWQLWSLGEHVRLVGDTDWLKGHASEVARVCRWIVEQRKKTMKLDVRGEKVPEYGLMPPGVMADWNNMVYYFCLNGYYYAGLRCAAEALGEIGHPEAAEFVRVAGEFREDILRAYRRTISISPIYALRNGDWVTAYPSQVYCPGPTAGFFPGEDGDRSWCYDVELGSHQIIPHGILDANSTEVTHMMDHMEDVQFLASGMGEYPAEANQKDWFNLGGFAKVQPYYCRNAEIYAMRDDVKPFVRSYFNMLATLLNTETLWLWEHFHNIAAWNKTHETGYFLHNTRLMLLMERGDQLWIAPFVTSNWMKDGMTVAMMDAPTLFGRMSYRIESHVGEGFIDAVVDPPSRNRPGKLVVRLRHPEGKPIRGATVNGKAHSEFDAARECIYITPSAGEIRIRAEY